MPEELETPDEHVRARMRQQRRAATGPEMKLRRILHCRGRRYRVGYPVPGNRRRSIDIAFPRQRLAVFVDGCYWHRCPDHHIPAKRNAAWWASKLEANVARDRATDLLLKESGWTVLRFWEHESMEAAATQIERFISARDAL
jgi:DNA mismatch endonuclease (patch repair protein)